MLGVLLVACGSGLDFQPPGATSPPDTQRPGSTEPEDTGQVPIITGTATVQSNPYNPFAAFVTVTLDLDAAVTVAYGESELDRATPPVDVLAGVPTEIQVLGLKAGRKWALRAEATHGR